MMKQIKILCAATALSCCMAVPAFAAETRAEYKEQAAPVLSELQGLQDEMKPVREENKAVAAKYKSLRLEKKNTGTLTISTDDWKRAKELYKQIVEIRKTQNDETVKLWKTKAKEAVKTKNFDTALENLNQALETKKTRRDALSEMNEIWKQIDELLD